MGSQMVRGISGGQRKRVTTGEMVVGPMKTLFLVSPSQQCSSIISHAFQLIQPHWAISQASLHYWALASDRPVSQGAMIPSKCFYFAGRVSQFSGPCGSQVCPAHFLITACMGIACQKLTCILCVLQDEISTGLDSSTTYLITKCIRNFVHMQEVSFSSL